MIFNRSYIFNFVSMFEKYNSTTILKYVNKYKHFLESIFRIDFENNRDFMVFYVLVILAMMFWNCSISWSRSYHVIVYCWGKIKLQKERPITFVHPPPGDDVARSYKRRSMNVKRFKELYNRIFVSRMKRISATIEKSLNNGLHPIVKTIWKLKFVQKHFRQYIILAIMLRNYSISASCS